MSKKKTKVEKKTIYAVINLDVSGSMGHLTVPTQKTYDSIVSELMKQKDQNTDIFCSLITFGSEVKVVAPLSSNESGLAFKYSATESSTRLFDGVLRAIKLLDEGVKIGKNDSFLVVTISDGLDNNSLDRTGNTMKQAMKGKESTDQWTFAFNLPIGCKANFVRDFGIDEGNCREWSTDIQGMVETQHVNTRSLSAFASNVKMGNYASKGFYSTVIADTDGLNTSVLKSNLIKVTNLFKKIPVKVSDAGSEIRSFVENKGLNYSKGCSFYELTKREILQTNKEIVVEDSNGDLYTGDCARNLLGIPINQKVKIKPDDYPTMKVFVKSNSVNRKLIENTILLYKKI